MKKTNAMRLLEAAGIAFRTENYEVDPDDLSGLTVAAKIGLAPEQVFKTLVVQGKDAYYFAVLPVDSQLDFKKLARLAGERKVAMAPLKEVRNLTGYLRGGVTVFGAKKAFPVFIDETAALHEEISVSAGVRGTQILLDPKDYLRAAGGVAGDLCDDAPSSCVESNRL